MHPGKFMDSPVDYGQRVRVHLYNKQGLLLGTVEGVAKDRETGVEVAPGMTKTLIWVTEIEDYQRHEGGELVPATEAWFPESDVEPIDDSPFRSFQTN